MRPTIGRRLVAEGLGSTLLLAVVVGSGIMAERLAGSNMGLALLANALATGGGLLALIFALGAISGAHFNPVVTLASAAQGHLPWRDTPWYILVQCTGAIAGVALAHAMFGVPIVEWSTHIRSGNAQIFSEFVATFGLLTVILGTHRGHPSMTPFAVSGYVVAGYWFTASTAFANPAVTLARTATNTFAGICPSDAPAFILAQCLGAACATRLFTWLLPKKIDEITK